ncbi:hypothetical protein K469DRAFT_378932 [Zopfia rhizophila CBS 207.26]|uniref:Rab proteins geranylgeranyltransferase n=1 Tax=Zopfia rhizophila CBS 207.26 TaxID=1314779 RepID=A0A6A6DCI1_9PEZI|nr:hypothetical protein K469DRAFT_378932 [Zopfia rhizophila CBS 207.26]
MDTLDGTIWDVLIVGTGIQQSLLALALSRSGKKILHIDPNDYYGGAEAAFSLQEAEEWANKVDAGSSSAAYANISISKPEKAGSDASAPSLSFSRAYSLALSPQLIYARSSLIQYLVSSNVYRQLEFLAVGSWWVYSGEPDLASNVIAGEPSEGVGQSRHGRLLKVPNGREDVFQDQVLDFKAKRALMKFLRFIVEYEEQQEVWEEHRQQPFPTFLSEQFKVPVALHAPLLALTLSADSSNNTTTEFALPRIARHLRSVGVFGAGFGSVIPKFGGTSEITQAACRASAVGGGVYALGTGLSSLTNDEPSGAERNSETVGSGGVRVRLKDDETVSTQWVIGEESEPTTPKTTYCRSITIVSSPLTPLFPPIAEEAPDPACAVIAFPSGGLSLDEGIPDQPELPPVHIFVHSSDTGECPAGQSVLYVSTSLSGEKGFQLLGKAVETLLRTVDISPPPTVLWSAQYEQRYSAANSSLPPSSSEHVLKFPPSSVDLAFDDSILDQVKSVWQKIMGDDAGEFLVFKDREANVDAEE